MSARPTHEISEEERRFDDGGDPQVLDIVEVDFAEPAPSSYQQENHVIDDTQPWRLQGRLTWAALQGAVEAPKVLWTVGDSSRHGENDRIPEVSLHTLTRSLYLVRPNDLDIVVGMEGPDESRRRRVRASFEFRLSVTDPAVERHYMGRQDGKMRIKQALLCVSLSEAFHGHAYKLVAAIITPRRRRA